MNLLAVILVVALCTQVSPQTLSNSTNVEDPPFQAEGCMQNGQCVCRVSSNWSSLSDYYELRRVKRELTNLKLTVISLDVQRILDRMENINNRINTLESSINQQSISVTMQEIQGIKRSVEILVGMVEQLRASGQTSEQLTQLMEQLEAMTTTVDELMERNPNGQSDELNSELEDLRQRLSACHNKVNWTVFVGDTLPINTTHDNWCDTHEIESFGDAYTHRWTTIQGGAWFKDPVPSSNASKTQLLTKVYGNGRRWLLRYENYPDFLSTRNPNNLVQLNTHGVGYVLYNQSLYYSYTNNIYRYDIQKGTTRAQAIVKSNINYASQPINSFVDIRVDEYGLWVIIATTENSNKLVVSKLDPITLQIGPSYATDQPKIATCAAFMACGKLYTFTSCTSALPLRNTPRQYVYDTRAPAGSSKESYIPLYIGSKYGHIYSLNYNPRERLVFGWDNSHLVTYAINWKTKSNA